MTNEVERLVMCIFGKLFWKKRIDKKDWFDCYRSSKILTEREIDFLRRYTEDEFMDAYKTHVGIDYILNTKKITLKDSCMAMMSINT